jgi:hypothetical protein
VATQRSGCFQTEKNVGKRVSTAGAADSGTPGQTQSLSQIEASGNMTESEKLLLRRWDNFLAAQVAYFDAHIVELVGHPHVPDEENVAFLQVDEKLAKPAIEEAVAEFICDGSWTRLDYRECLHLVFRAHVARTIISAVLRGTPQGTAIEPTLPDLKNREDAIQWFLIDLWNLVGKPFLAAVADDWLKKRRESTP